MCWWARIWPDKRTIPAVFFLLNWPVNVKIQLKFSSGIYCSVFSSIHGNRVSRPPSVKKIVLCSQNIGGDWCEWHGVAVVVSAASLAHIRRWTTCDRAKTWPGIGGVHGHRFFPDGAVAAPHCSPCAPGENWDPSDWAAVMLQWCALSKRIWFIALRRIV